MPPTPSPVIDEADLVLAIRDLYGLRESDMDLPGVAERVADLVMRVDQAQREGKITRYARTNPATGTVTGHCYKRPELYGFLSTQPGFRRATGVPA